MKSLELEQSSCDHEAFYFLRMAEQKDRRNLGFQWHLGVLLDFLSPKNNIFPFCCTNNTWVSVTGNQNNPYTYSIQGKSEIFEGLWWVPFGVWASLPMGRDRSNLIRLIPGLIQVLENVV